MADGDETTASSGGPRKLLLPTAPGPAQPLTHLGVRFRKQLDASLSSQGYYALSAWKTKIKQPQHGEATGKAKARLCLRSESTWGGHPGLITLAWIMDPGGQ